MGKLSDSLTLGRPNSLGELRAYGQFSIGHLVLWTNELTQYEVQVAFESVLFKTKRSRLCCHSRKGNELSIIETACCLPFSNLVN